MVRLSPRWVRFMPVFIVLTIWVLYLLNMLFHWVDFREIFRLDLAGNLLPTTVFFGLQGAALVGLVLGTLRLSGERLRDLGLHGDRLGRQLWVGALWGLGIFILANFLLDPVAEAVFPSTAADRETVTGMFKNLWHLPLLLMLGIFKGGCLEECWRIFVLTRFERAFARVGLLFALAAGSIMFGLGHAYQGTSGIITLAGVGLAYAGVYLRKRRAMEAVAAHAVYDIIAISLGFLIYHGR